MGQLEMLKSPVELNLVWAWERSTWMRAAAVGRKQTSVSQSVSQCVQGAVIEPSSSLWLCALPTTQSHMYQKHFIIKCIRNEQSHWLLTCHQEQQWSCLEHDGAATANNDRQNQSQLHCFRIPSRVHRVSTLLLYFTFKYWCLMCLTFR